MFRRFKWCIQKLRNGNIIETVKACSQEKILSIFNDLPIEQKDMLDISKITDPLHIEPYLKELDKYVYGMEKITAMEITKVFKKEKS